MKILSGIVLAFPLLLQQTTGGVSTSGGIGTIGFAAAAVVSPPTMTYRWAADSAGNTCGTTGASSCTTNGQALYSEADQAGSNTITQTVTGNQPVYTTSGLNGLPVATFSSGKFWNLTTSLPAPGTTATQSFYLVVNPANFTAYQPLVGDSGDYSVGWEFAPTGKLSLEASGVAHIGDGTFTYTAGTWYTVILTWNLASGAWDMGHCVSGAYSSDGSGSSGAGTYNLIGSPPYIGQDTRNSFYFIGSLAEYGFRSTAASTSSICTWTQAHWGV